MTPAVVVVVVVVCAQIVPSLKRVTDISLQKHALRKWDVGGKNREFRGIKKLLS